MLVIYFVYFSGEGVQAESEAPAVRAGEQHRRDQGREHGRTQGQIFIKQKLKI